MTPDYFQRQESFTFGSIPEAELPQNVPYRRCGTRYTAYFYILFLLSLLLWSCEKESETPGIDKTQPGTILLDAETKEVFEPKPVLKHVYVRALCLNVRRSPGTSGDNIGFVFQGDRLSVLEISQTGNTEWYLINDDAGFVEGWISARYSSDTPVKSTYTHVNPDEYRGAKTPTVIEGISAKYLGVAACISCHDEPHAGFAKGPYGVWRDHFHSSAFQTLSRNYTKAFAKKRGIVDPVTNWRCRKCHVTALGVPPERLGPKYRDADGVGCETCHGPGGDYLHEHYKEDADQAALAAMGFRVYRNLEDRDKLCRSCHNTLSPTYKPFNVLEFSKAIRHWETEFTVKVVDPEQEPIIGEREPVEQPEPISDAELTALVTPPPPEEVPETNFSQGTPTTAPITPTSNNPLLAGIAKEWILNRTGERGAVFFPHLAHVVNNVRMEGEGSVCQVCHHTTQPGFRPTNCSDGNCHKFESTLVVSREKAFHNTCRTCHREENAGPQTCSECHKQDIRLEVTMR